ncbi:MAG: AMP-binding protein [Christensenellales bacterium]|jgi:fatty-acyl-CoA synthase
MPEFINMTIGDLLDSKAKAYPDKDALIHPYEGVRYSTAQFKAVCDRAARGLIALGVKKGDHVAIWATNYPHWVISLFATAKIGAVLVTVNTNYKKFELEYLLKQSDSMTLIMTGGIKDNDYVDHIYSICPELAKCPPGRLKSKKLPYLKNVIFLDSNSHPGMLHWSDLEDAADSVSEEERIKRQKDTNPHDVINMMYTSGTTGFPKGVMLTHYNLVNNGKTIGAYMRFSEKDRLCIPVPLFHCFGCVLGVMAAVTNDTAMVILDHFNPEKVMNAIDTEKCTAVHGVPTMFIAMLGHKDFGKYDFSSLRTGIMAGSPCPTEVMKVVVERMGAKEITIVYGQTESSPGITQTKTDDPLELRVSTVGRAYPNVEAKIINPETGADVSPGVIGEIVTRGYHVMKGYYKMPEATAQVIDNDGWLHTGDLGVMDENGYYKITGRLKDMIIRGGENIYPREIEEYLYTHPNIKDVQVVGVPDVKYGEEVLACVILNDGVNETEESIITFVKKGLSKFKAPRYVRFIDAFPMTASGKIQKYKLREWAVAELNLEDVANIETA